MSINSQPKIDSNMSLEMLQYKYFICLTDLKSSETRKDFPLAATMADGKVQVLAVSNLVQMVSTVKTLSTSAECFHLLLEFPLTDICPVVYYVQSEAEIMFRWHKCFLGRF